MTNHPGGAGCPACGGLSAGLPGRSRLSETSRENPLAASRDARPTSTPSRDDARGGTGFRLSWRAKFARFFQLILALLRELADENAYHRHLQARGRQPSAEEWRRFSEERLRAKYARAKCC